MHEQIAVSIRWVLLDVNEGVVNEVREDGVEALAGDVYLAGVLRVFAPLRPTQALRVQGRPCQCDYGAGINQTSEHDEILLRLATGQHF